MGANNNQFTVQVGLYCVRMNLACIYLGDNDVPARMIMQDAANTVMMQLKGSRAIDNTNVVTNETSLIINVTVPQIFSFKILDETQATVQTDTRITFEQL
jgi:hypothetical protein